MSPDNPEKKGILLLGKILCLLALVSAALWSRRAAMYIDPYGLLFVMIGGVAGALMTFSGREIRKAFSHAYGASGGAFELHRSALFWEAAARNFWILGVLRSILGFVSSLGSLSAGIASLTSGLADSLLATFYGMILTVICYVPCWKLHVQVRHERPHEGPVMAGLPAASEIGNWTLSHFAGYGLFAAILGATILRPPVTGIGASITWIVYWPSLLVVWGSTLGLLLFMGNGTRHAVISPAFAITGMIGSLIGFIQVLWGVSAGKIEDISAALTFILSSCFAALIGMFLLGGPLEDRAAIGSGEIARTPLNRAAWFVFPLLALVMLVAVFVIIVTPFEKPQ